MSFIISTTNLMIALLISLVFNLLFLYRMRVQKKYIKELHKFHAKKIGIVNMREKIREFLDEGVNNHE
ncbi:MAG: hypothetical protein B6I28_02905 [Fusobacteriia bacterium 4572_132]|nr:MAG: hypothetical protein B6I28_02905 [Fusobacteriia bacterium 4572_132]